MGNDGGHEVESSGPAAKRRCRFMIADVRGDIIPFGVRNVRRIGHKRSERCFVASDGMVEQRFEEVAADRVDAISNGVSLGVLACNFEGAWREVCGNDASMLKVPGDGDGDAPRAGADIGDQKSVAFVSAEARSATGMLNDLLNNDGGARPGNKNTTIDVHGEAKKPCFADEILNRFVGQGTRDKFA